MHTDARRDDERPLAGRARALVAGVLLVTLVVTAGCSLQPDSEPIRASASVASVPDATLDSTGYEPVGAGSPWLNVTVTESIQGDVELSSTRDVRARTQVRTYRRTTDAGPAFVAVHATPAVRLFENRNRTMNPARELSTAELANRTQPTYSEISGVKQTGTRTMTLLGDETTGVVYRASATRDGESTSVEILLATVERGGDFVTVVATVPAGADDRSRVRTLVEAVER